MENNVNPQVIQAVVDRKSYFDGGLWGLIGVNIVTYLLSILSLGLAWPALWCYNKRWYYKHICIDGNRLKFTGTGWQLFGKHLLWTFLTIITFGIYGFWRGIKLTQWEISHVEIDHVEVKAQ